MAKVSGGVPIYVNEKEVHQATVRGEVHIDNNHLTITHPYGDNQAIQLLGNAKLYTVNNNTLLLTNNPDKPVIGFYGSGLEQKPTLQVDGNHIVTANKPLFANWVQSVMQDKLGNAYDGAMQIINNTHSKNGEVSALNDTLVFAQDQGQFVFFAPNVNTDELKQLILIPNTQALLEHIGQVGNDVFVDKTTNHTHHMYGSRGDDVLIVGGGGHELMGGVGKDQFVFVSSHKSATQIQLNTIMDFDKQNDLIKLVCGDKERIDNVNFDHQKKLLSYDVHHDGVVYHHHILINPKQQVLSEDVLNAIQII